jgi:hypothetical protein
MWKASLLALFAVAGCSFVTMPAASSVAEPGRDCRTSRAAPAVDTALAVAGGIAAIFGTAIIVRTALDDDVDQPKVAYIGGAMYAVPGALGLAGFGLSARHGFRSARACARRGRP